jgi:hypothetical protein
MEPIIQPMQDLGSAPELNPAVPTMVAPPPEENEIVVKAEILKRIEDSLSIEREWRSSGQTIQMIYRGQLDASGSGVKGNSRFNSLNANTAILLPSLFSKCPTPDIRPQTNQTTPIIDQACQILEEVSEVILKTSDAYNAIRAAVLEVLLPGRGICRVRWDPIVETVDSVDPMTGAPVQNSEKLLDQLYLEHVYWEDFTYEQTPRWKDCGWVAFRHLMTEKTFMSHFEDAPAVQELIAAGKTAEIFRWTDRSANNSRVNRTGSPNSGSRVNNSEDLQDTILKAIVWEYWDKSTREVIWICNDMGGKVLRISPDPMELTNFFPCPQPIVAVTTTDRQLPVPEYSIYQDLAMEVDDTSDRIAAIVKRIKVVGAYDGSQDEMKNLLKQVDGAMVPINGMDINFDLSKHIWMLPLQELITALQTLYQARDQSKQAMYEVTGISDIVRGSTRASETLGAQQMKTQFAALRIEDRKRGVEYFSQGLIEIICEVVAKHFSPESIFYYTDIMPFPETMQILQDEGLRISRIEVETDSTAMVDSNLEQENMAKMLQSLGLVLQQIGPMVQGGMLPMPIAMEFIKIALKPFKHSRDITALIDKTMMMMMGPQAVQQPGAPAPGGMQVIQGGMQ